jgi:hypothetical protein
MRHVFSLRPDQELRLPGGVVIAVQPERRTRCRVVLVAPSDHPHEIVRSGADLDLPDVSALTGGGDCDSRHADDCRCDDCIPF